MPVQQCTYCNRKFTRTEHLQRHVRSHTKEKPFKCETCGKGYVREDTLLRHAKLHVTGRPRRMTMSEVSMTHTDDRTPSSGQPSPETNMIISTPNHMFHINTSSVPQAQPHSITSSASVPIRSVDEFGTRPNMYEFGNREIAEDDSLLWAFNGDYLMNSIDMAGVPGQPDYLQSQPTVQQLNPYVSDKQFRPESTQPPPLPDMRDIWFTKWANSHENVLRSRSQSPIRSPVSQSTLPPDEQEPADEQYRQGLSIAFIQPLQAEDSLPSSSFLNLCVRMYLKRFNPIFPIIHEGTFRTTPENSFLFLSMASAGCLFLGSQVAVRRGKSIFEKLNKVIISSWDNIFCRKTSEIIAMIQAAIIGQTFAMLSGDGRHFAIFDAYHGSLISFARRERLFDARPIPCEGMNLTGDELDVAWRKWARKEELSRISQAIQIQDGELSALLHQKSLLRHAMGETQVQTSPRVFSARTASEWASAAADEAALSTPSTEQVPRRHPRDSFSGYVKLEGLGVSIADDWRQGRLDHIQFSTYEAALLNWHKSYADPRDEGQGHLCLMTLWHWTYMSLLVDFDQLERAIGRDGPDAAREGLGYVSKWVTTLSASRCVLHALLLQKQFQSFRFEDTPAVHVPKALFSAAIAWSCYIQYGPKNQHPGSSIAGLDKSLPEFSVLGRNAYEHLSYVTNLRWKKGITSSTKAATLCELGRMLERMKEWGLAGKFANIVARLVEAEPQPVIAC